MTYQGIIDLASIKYDDFANPFFDADRKVALLFDSIMEFVQQAYDEGELDERKKEQLLPLVQPVTPVITNSADDVFAVASFLTTGIPGFMFVYDLSGMFKNTCGSGYVFQPIVPLKMDNFNRARQDSFDRPSDEYPKYKSVASTVMIYSDTSPQSVNMNFVKMPFQPTISDLALTPELASSTHNAIAAILEGKFDEASEKLQKVQFAQMDAALQQ